MIPDLLFVWTSVNYHLVVYDSVAGPSTQRVDFYPTLVHVGFLVDGVTQGQDYLRGLVFSSLSIIPPGLQNGMLFITGTIILAVDTVGK
jgi:hypothetical protein